jgi:hypothetical protein
MATRADRGSITPSLSRSPLSLSLSQASMRPGRENPLLPQPVPLTHSLSPAVGWGGVAYRGGLGGVQDRGAQDAAAGPGVSSMAALKMLLRQVCERWVDQAGQRSQSFGMLLLPDHACQRWVCQTTAKGSGAAGARDAAAGSDRERHGPQTRVCADGPTSRQADDGVHNWPAQPHSAAASGADVGAMPLRPPCWVRGASMCSCRWKPQSCPFFAETKLRGLGRANACALFP